MQPSLASPLQMLAGKWHMFSVMLVALARLLRRNEDSLKPGTAEAAAQLEIAARTAQILLVGELAEALETGPPQSTKDETALAFLRFTTLSLLAIAYVAANIRARARPATIWRRAGIPGVHRSILPIWQDALVPIPFLDSS